LQDNEQQNLTDAILYDTKKTMLVSIHSSILWHYSP